MNNTRYCPHCGKPKEPHNATCTHSKCQEAEYHANRERNAQKRRKRSR